MRIFWILVSLALAAPAAMAIETLECTAQEPKYPDLTTKVPPVFTLTLEASYGNQGEILSEITVQTTEGKQALVTVKLSREHLHKVRSYEVSEPLIRLFEYSDVQKAPIYRIHLPHVSRISGKDDDTKFQVFGKSVADYWGLWFRPSTSTLMVGTYSGLWYPNPTLRYFDCK